MNRLLAVTLVTVCLCSVSGCGGSLGSDPSAGQSSATPTANSGSLAATMGAATTGTLSGQGAGTLTYAISTPPQNGVATITNSAIGAFTYTSYPDFTGNDSLQFTVTDGTGTSPPATETVQVTSAALGAPQVVANVGGNTDWVCYWCTMQPFVNVVGQSSAFGDPNTGYPLIEEGKLDANGWPEADFRWMVLSSVTADGSASDPGPASPLVGKYHLSFNGIAKIGDDGGSVEDQQYNAATNTTTATLDQIAIGSDGTDFDMLLSFSSTQRTASSPTDTGVTNIQIIRPQFAPNGTKWWDSPQQEFTDPFLASFKGLSTIRYENWTAVIGSPEVNWSDRTPANWPVAGHLMQAAPGSLKYLPGKVNCTQYCDWYGTGASWESAIDVANATHTDMWINIPVMASDAYVKSLAALIKSKLDPGLHVYIEWSDEIWNYGNPYWTETNYNSDQVKALIASNPAEAANYKANCDSYAYAECHVAERVMQFDQDFASVYGTPAITTTIRPVLCTQFVQPVFLMEALRFIAQTYGPPSNYFYGVCGAPYWAPSGATSTLPAGATQAAVVAAIDSGIASDTPTLATDTAIALHYGLHNFTYEGGPDYTGITITGDTSAQQSATMQAAMLDPGMKSDVINGLTTAFASGIDMYMYYSIAGSGAYGAFLDQTNLSAPKLAGIQAVQGQLVTRNAGVTLPGMIAVTQSAYALDQGAAVPGFDNTGWYCEPASGSNPAYCAVNGTQSSGSGWAYLVDVPSAGSYAVSLVLMTGNGGISPNSIEIDVDRKSIGTLSLVKTPAGTPYIAGPLTVNLTAGLHILAIRDMSPHGTGGLALASIQVATQ